MDPKPAKNENDKKGCACRACSCCECVDGGRKHFSDKKIFEIAREQRNFEIRMFWQRCNYFLLLNTSVGAAFAAAIAGSDVLLGESLKMPFFIVAAAISFVGAVVCFAWVKVGLGAKFWQSYWEQVLIDFQDKVGFGPVDGDEKTSEKKNFFSRPNYDQHLYDRVKKNLSSPANQKTYRPDGLGFYNGMIIKKPSVSGWMEATAFFFLGVWSIVTILCIAKILYLLFCSCGV